MTYLISMIIAKLLARQPSSIVSGLPILNQRAKTEALLKFLKEHFDRCYTYRELANIMDEPLFRIAAMITRLRKDGLVFIEVNKLGEKHVSYNWPLDYEKKKGKNKKWQ